MRILPLAQTLHASLSTLPEAERTERLQAFLTELKARRMWKLLPRIVAALSEVEIATGHAPVAVTVAEPSAHVPADAERIIDPQILGGATITRGDDLTDASLATSLHQLSKTLHRP